METVYDLVNDCLTEKWKGKTLDTEFGQFKITRVQISDGPEIVVYFFLDNGQVLETNWDDEIEILP